MHDLGLTCILWLPVMGLSMLKQEIGNDTGKFLGSVGILTFDIRSFAVCFFVVPMSTQP